MNHTIWLIQYACWVTDVYTDFTSHSQNICHICHICHLWNIIIVGIKTEIRNYELFWPDNPDNGYWGNPDGPLEQGKGTNKYLETYHTNCFFVLDGNTATGQINTIFFSTNRSTVTVRANLAWMKLSREIVEAHWKTHLSFMSWGTVQCFGGGRDRTNIEQFFILSNLV